MLRVLVLAPFVLLMACQSRSEALDMLCNAPATCGSACETGDVDARLTAMRTHLDSIIENDSVRKIYQEYWAQADRATLDTMSRAAMAEERGRDDCAYFEWYRQLWSAQPQQ